MNNGGTSAGLLFTDARIATPEGTIAAGWLATRGSLIYMHGPGRPPSELYVGRDVIPAGGAFLLPGFIDVHVHGAVGHEVMDAEVAGLQDMAHFFATHGVTGFLPTTWTADTSQTIAALSAIGKAMKAGIAGARILGAHMEGPYLSLIRAGAQDPAAIRAASMSEARQFLDTGVVRLITLAPEVEENVSLIEECLARGVRVSVGHSDATFDQIRVAALRGARHLTHAFNAMRSLHHREPGGAGAALMLDDLMAELIADNVHVHPAVMALLLKARGPAGVVLVTDAIRPTGVGTPTSTIGGRTVEVVDGAVRLPGGTLAGSLLTMDAALRNLARASGQSLGELWPTASQNGAIAAGVADCKGLLRTGFDADLVLVDDDVNVQLTVVDGRIIWRASEA